MYDLEYYKLVVKTQNEPYILKQELKDLIHEIEAEKNHNLVTELDEETWNLSQRLIKGHKRNESKISSLG